MYNLNEEKIECILDVLRPYIQTEKGLKENRKLIHALFNAHKVENVMREKTWNETDATWIVSTLTSLQRIIVMNLVKGESKLSNLISALQKEDPKASGVQVGGACAGLHRKCNQRQLPHLIKCRQDEKNEWCYSLIPQALPFFKQGIKQPIGFGKALEIS